jgi:tetraacyldisaccharide 4'-kinase
VSDLQPYSALLRAAAMPYRAATALKNAAYDRGWRQPRRLQWPVLSVGNLSTGGTGKTPFVLLLAQLLAQAGWQPDVLTRGYGRSSREVLRVTLNPEDPDPASRFGDEPLLLAHRGLPVFVGANRWAAGRLAEQSPASRGVHVLDDGFQHRRLARTADIVLLQARDFHDRLLPAGNLREPLSSLRRADICVLAAEDAAYREQALDCMQTSDPRRVWTIQRQTNIPLEAQRVPSIVFCGIGKAEQFFIGVQLAGATPATTLRWPDHHRYTAADIRHLQSEAARRHAKIFLTTEKDWWRLTPTQRAALEATAPLRIASLSVTLLDPPGALDDLLHRLTQPLGIV